MDTANLKTFLTVVDSQGFSNAAKKLYISQSTVSQQIKALENELGCDLFNHSQRKFQITEEGRVFYQRAKEMLGLYLTTLGEFKTPPCSVEPMRVSIAMDVAFGRIVAPGLWGDFCKKNPTARLTFIPCESTREALGLVQTHGADVALTFESVHVMHCGLEFSPIWTVGECCIMAREHALAGLETVKLEDLEGCSVTFLHPKGAVLYEELLRSQLVRARMGVEVLEFKDLRGFDAERLAHPPVLMMPSISSGREYFDRVSVPFDWEDGPRLGIAVSERHSAATSRFIEHFQRSSAIEPAPFQNSLECRL